MKEEKKLLNFKNRILLCLVAGFIALMALGVRAYAAGPFSTTYEDTELYFYKGDFTFCPNETSDYSQITYEFENPDDIISFVYNYNNSVVGVYIVSVSKSDFSLTRTFYDRDGDVSSGNFSFTSYRDLTLCNASEFDCSVLPYVTNTSLFQSLCRDFAYSGLANEFQPPVEIPDMDSLEKNYDFYLKDFACDNSITATWDGTVTNEYENDVSYVVAYLGYAFKEQPAQIAVRELYNGKALVTDNSFYIPWDEVQHDDENLYLRYVEFVPYGKLNPDKVFLPYIKGNSSFIYFSVDASGTVDKIKVPTFVDNNSFTTNIPNGVFDSSIPALSDIERINNGFADPLSSYSQSVTFKWSTVFDDPNYYIQVRTTFRYKLNVDKVWEEITIDTSVPTGRYSCLVDNSSFTYTYGDYGPLFWQQDDSIWTDDSLDKHGNLQPVRDSIRVVHVEDGYVSYGPWTTFTLKNGMWWHGTGEITGSYEVDILEEDNTGGSIVEDGEVNSNFLTDFDFTDISGVWNTFIGIFKNLFSFLGQFPDLFSQIFSFLPYEIRSMFYVSMAAICVLGLVRAVIK